MTATVPAPAPPAASSTDGVVLDLHGELQVHVVGGTAADTAGVRRQLGVPSVPAADPTAARLTIRFVDDVALDGPLHPLGAREAGFAGQDFLVLRTFGKAPCLVRVPVDELGADGVELVARSGTPGIPLLLPTINLMLLQRGVLPLHAAAVELDGHGVLLTGWSKGGKTEVLLALAEEGARYVGDEWVYLRPADGTMFGLPEPMRLWDWHLAQRPRLWRTLPAGTRARLRATQALVGPSHAPVSPTAPSALRRAQVLARRQLSVRLPPATVFGPDRIAPSATIDTVVLVMTRDDPAVSIAPVAPAEVVDRMLASLEEERHDLLATDRMFRFAFPGRANPLLADAGTRERELLAAALDGRSAHRLDHPTPVAFPRLASAVRSVL